jgi:hypothetical protein
MQKDLLDSCKRLQRLQELSFLTEFAGAIELGYSEHQFHRCQSVLWEFGSSP